MLDPCYAGKLKIRQSYFQLRKLEFNSCPQNIFQKSILLNLLFWFEVCHMKMKRSISCFCKIKEVWQVRWCKNHQWSLSLLKKVFMNYENLWNVSERNDLNEISLSISVCLPLVLFGLSCFPWQYPFNNLTFTSLLN